MVGYAGFETTFGDFGWPEAVGRDLFLETRMMFIVRLYSRLEISDAVGWRRVFHPWPCTLPQDWRRSVLMKVFVTGAAGFVGSRLSRQLLNRGDTVVGID